MTADSQPQRLPHNPQAFDCLLQITRVKDRHRSPRFRWRTGQPCLDHVVFLFILYALPPSPPRILAIREQRSVAQRRGDGVRRPNSVATAKRPPTLGITPPPRPTPNSSSLDLAAFAGGRFSPRFIKYQSGHVSRTAPPKQPCFSLVPESASCYQPIRWCGIVVFLLGSLLVHGKMSNCQCKGFLCVAYFPIFFFFHGLQLR